MMFVDLENGCETISRQPTRIPALLNPYRSRKYIPDVCAFRDKITRTKNNKIGIKITRKLASVILGLSLCQLVSNSES